jgi:flagellar protein FlaI
VDSLIKRYFPTSTAQESQFFSSYVLLNSVGLGELELLLADESLEEVAINGAGQSIWVFHRRQGWCKTNIVPTSEDQIKYYASTIGRKAGRQISVLEPLLDVTLNVGDRVNATLMPISNEGNTITIRKFSAKPWTITEFLDSNVVSFRAAAILWHAIQYELSILIAGGTASGKTSILNILSNFFPPDQRIISIEDTREIKLPKILHVVPMLTRLANSEGRGGVSMLNLLQNSLRMRPDRILVGEIRKPAEAEVLFEAIHTGHSVYATIHANTAEETVTRLTNAPMNVPATMIPALSLVVVQYRNRRTGVRKTFEIAEITPSGTARVLFRYNVTKDILAPVEKPKHLYETFSTFTGATIHEIEAEIDLKEQILHWMCDQKLDTVESIGLIMAEFYANREQLLARLKLRTKKHKK